MRRHHLLALAFALALPLAASAQQLTVSAAASLTDAFKELGPRFEATRPGATLRLNFAASGALLQQIAQGAPVDVFASADQDTMNRAADQKLVDTATRRNFAANSLVLIEPAQGGAGIKSAAAPWAIAACLGATTCYAIAASFTKRYLGGLPSLVTATGSQVGASLALALPTAWYWPAQSPSSTAWLAALAVGVRPPGGLIGDAGGAHHQRFFQFRVGVGHQLAVDQEERFGRAPRVAAGCAWECHLSPTARRAPGPRGSGTAAVRPSWRRRADASCRPTGCRRGTSG